MVTGVELGISQLHGFPEVDLEVDLEVNQCD
jgi:hypothetical protein